ncbi:EamA family transporter [Acetivibrio cellulolyticus]|uniref:EamA family transporter n=1 Tax=Acetivibrio cellulolyticus TaxID=35830 RepID=UPI0001E2EB90|nr:EamA family transporter [Acetivibrio cellulolyticus]
MNIYWPIALIVISNIFYNICSKQTPDSINPLASLTITYIIGAITSGVMYFVLNRDGNLLREYNHLNWTAFVLGIAIVGLEAGSIYMYKAGWNINSGQLLYSSILAIALIFVGYFLYHEVITWTKVVGITICLIGLVFISK